MKLEPLMNYHADLLPAVMVGAGPQGTRAIFEVTGGAFEGPALRGKLLTGGGDWMLIDAQGMGHLDVRATFETHDGALIYVQYFGRVVVTEAINQALQGNGATDYGDTHFFTQPRFETGDARYAWLNQVVAVARGRVCHGRVEYQVFACAND